MKVESNIIAVRPDNLQTTGALGEQKPAKILVDYFLAAILVSVITMVFLFSRAPIFHWFILPAMACGLLAGVDLIRWLRGDLDTFDPKALVGLILFHGWFLAPLLHVFWDLYGYELNLALDPRPWLGGACLVNLVGILCYKASQQWSFRRTAPVGTFRRLIPARLLLFLLVAVVVGVAAQFYFYQKFFAAMKLRDRELAVEAMRGTGWLLMLGDSIPTLLALSLIATNPHPKRRRTWIVVGLVLLALAVAQFFWSGLRGSRSAFVGIMFFSTCLIHFWWRRLRPVHLIMALGLLLPFMYFYGFYKGAGASAVKAFESERERLRLERKTGRTFPGMLLGDLARADVQARIVQEIATRDNEYQWRYGKTYLKALSQLIPYTLWDLLIGDLSFKDRWDKAFAFVELNSGRVKQQGYFPKSSRVYGLSGEAMLNFGFWGVPPAWLLYGLVMGWMRRKLYTLPRQDARWLIMPLVIGLTMGIPTSDMDLLVYGSFKGGFVPFLLVYLSSRKLSDAQM